MFKNRIATVLLILAGLIFFNSCKEQHYIDPFWNIDLDANQTSINSNLKDKSLKGSFQECIFSYEKVFYINAGKFDARVTENLNNPVFSNNKLSQMKYSLSVDFKNDETYLFNQDFYLYLVNKFEKTYGQPCEETNINNDIKLKWSLKNGKSVDVYIIKDLNTYQVLYQNQSK